MNAIILNFIQWPSPEQQQCTARYIQDICSLSGVVGLIDGTHIRISSALQSEKDYYNRKGFPSIQLRVFSCEVDTSSSILHSIDILLL